MIFFLFRPVNLDFLDIPRFLVPTCNQFSRPNPPLTWLKEYIKQQEQEGGSRLAIDYYVHILVASRL